MQFTDEAGWLANLDSGNWVSILKILLIFAPKIEKKSENFQNKIKIKLK